MQGDDVVGQRAGPTSSSNWLDFTGLSPDYLERNNLRIEIMRFTKELLRGQRRTVGRLDSRFTGIDRDAGGEHREHDPSLTHHRRAVYRRLQRLRARRTELRERPALRSPE